MIGQTILVVLARGPGTPLITPFSDLAKYRQGPKDPLSDLNTGAKLFASYLIVISNLCLRLM